VLAEGYGGGAERISVRFPRSNGVVAGNHCGFAWITYPAPAPTSNLLNHAHSRDGCSSTAASLASAIVASAMFKHLGVSRMTRQFLRALALSAALTIGHSPLAFADIKDYEFQLIDKEVKEGQAVVTVKLIQKSTGKAIPDAVIFAKRIDMGPDQMEAMTAPLDLLPGSEPGIYRFKTDLTMAGQWALTLGAKVQGESGTVENRLIVKATK
jgi:YtkA-like